MLGMLTGCQWLAQVGLAITSVLALHTLSLLIFEGVNETKPVLG